MRTIRGEHNGGELRIGVVASRFNEEITSRLLEGALKALEIAGVAGESVLVVSVPGAFEVPGAAAQLASSKRVDAVVCLGAVVRGETEHFTFVAAAAQEGILRASLDTGVPMTFGVLTTDTVEQALERAGGEAGNKGYEAALDAVEMATLYRELA
ncbi:MAG: 6,7-dimethyl-8-ribityllumazine synthase [Actinomycetota bacterium]